MIINHFWLGGCGSGGGDGLVRAGICMFCWWIGSVVVGGSGSGGGGWWL